MKKLYSLIAILVAIFFAQNVYAELTYNIEEPAPYNNVWYNAIWTGEHNLQGGENKNNLNFYFPPHTNGAQNSNPYPSDQVTFEFKTNSSTSDGNRYVYIDKLVGSTWSNYENGKVSEDKKYKSFTKSVPEDARAIAFKSYNGSSGRYIKNVYVRMAPHIRLNTTSLTFSSTAVGTKETKTIDFDSFLAGPGGLIVSIVNDPDGLFSIEMNGSTGKSITKSQHTFESKTSNSNSIKVHFSPKNIQAEAKTCTINITTKKNDNTTITKTITVTYTSSFNHPTLTLDANAFEATFLKWNKIDGATEYRLYDNGKHITTYSSSTTSAAISGLTMGSSHNYTITSYYQGAESKHSKTISVVTPTYPKVSSLTFSNVQQNQFTINWNKVPITYPGHEFIRYQIHVYSYNYEGNHYHYNNYYITDNNTTSLKITDVDDATRFDVFVGVDFRYTVNGTTKSYDVSAVEQWVSNSITTQTTYNSSAEISNGIYIYKGEWHYINVNIANELLGTLLSKQWPFYYPQENLKYCAWVEAAGNVTHYVEDDATGKKYKLTGTNYGYATYTASNKFQTDVLSISKSLDKVVFTGSRDPFGGQKIYVGEAFSRVARHIKLKNTEIDLGTIRKDRGTLTATINFHSFLVDGALTASSNNSDFKVNKTTLANKATTKAGTFCQTGNTSYDFTVTFTPNKLGDQSAVITISDGKVSTTITLKANVYDINQFVSDGNWEESSNWTYDLPNTADNIEIKAAVTIPNGYTAIANNIEILEGGSIIIEPQGILKTNKIYNATKDNLILNSDATGSAILLFTNGDADGYAEATINQYIYASSEGLRNGQEGNFKNPKWQYFGVLVSGSYNDIFNPDGKTNWIYRWDETQNATTCWAQKLSGSYPINAWSGYCIAQESAKTYKYSGRLVTNNHTYPLTYTESENSTDDLGNNLIANSYTAPIDITTLSGANFTNADTAIIIYNTGSYQDWSQAANQTGFAPGQVIVIPANVGAVLGNEYPHTIASGQAFFVKAKGNDAKFTINYMDNVYNGTKTENIKRSKAQNNNTFNVLKINVVSETSNDRLYLLEHAKTTADYDNGYDAEKIFDNPNGPQIYATTSFGQTSINSDLSFNNQYVGFVANDENELYTISFDIENLHSYNNLFLYDTETDIYVDILAEETYQFYGSTIPNHNRFLIISHEDAPSQDTTTNLEVITWDDITNVNEIVYIYTTTGQLVNIVNPNTTYQNSLPTGVYIVKYSNKTLKMINK